MFPHWPDLIIGIINLMIKWLQIDRLYTFGPPKLFEVNQKCKALNSKMDQVHIQWPKIATACCMHPEHSKIEFEFIKVIFRWENRDQKTGSMDYQLNKCHWWDSNLIPKFTKIFEYSKNFRFIVFVIRNNAFRRNFSSWARSRAEKWR